MNLRTAWPWLTATAVGVVALTRRNPVRPAPSAGLEGAGSDGEVVGPQPRSTVQTSAKEIPRDPVWRKRKLEEEDVPDQAAAYGLSRTIYVSDGREGLVSFDAPPGNYILTIRAMTPDIGYAVKINGTFYGIGWGPPGSTPVLNVIVGAVNVAADLAPIVGAAVGAGPATAAIGTAAQAVASIVATIPNLVTKARVKTWALFRAGKWGSKNKRAAIRSALGQWYDPSRLVASTYGTAHGYWRFEGSGGGTWPVTAYEPPFVPGSSTKPLPGGTPIAAQDPSVKALVLDNGYLRFGVLTPPSAHIGEVRYDISLFKMVE